MIANLELDPEITPQFEKHLHPQPSNLGLNQAFVESKL
jgi:hypothetical protein